MPNPFGNKPYTISQPYGPTEVDAEPAFRGAPHYHCGIDLYALPWNTPIYSLTNGIVFQAGTDRSDGAMYVIVHDGANYLAYWHLSAIAVKTGQQVSVGTQLGNQGATGRAHGAHLHLEVQHKQPYGSGLHSPNECIDPTPYLDAQGGAEDMTLEEYAADMLDVIEDNPHYQEQKPDAFAGHVAWLKANSSWDQRRAWVKGIMANNKVLNATYMREHLAGDDQIAAGVKDLEVRIAQTKADILALKEELAQTRAALEAARSAPKGVDPIECQQRVDAAAREAYSQLHAVQNNPWPTVVTWFRTIWKD